MYFFLLSRTTIEELAKIISYNLSQQKPVILTTDLFPSKNFIVFRWLAKVFNPIDTLINVLPMPLTVFPRFHPSKQSVKCIGNFSHSPLVFLFPRFFLVFLWTLFFFLCALRATHGHHGGVPAT